MTQRKDGRWVKAITIDGTRKSFYSKEPTEKRAEKDIQRQILEYDKNLYIQKHNFGNLLDEVLEDKEEEVENQTYQCYYYAAKLLEEFRGDNIEDITILQFRAFLDALAKKNYSRSQIQKVKIVASLVCEKAIINGINLVNFAQMTKIPKKTKKPQQKKPISDEGIGKIVKNAHAPFGMFAYLLVFTGMRRGELLALQKKDIDLKNNIIHITKSVEYPSNQPVIKGTKTQSSTRDVPIMPFIVDDLSQYISPLSADDYLFEGSSPLSKTSVRKRWLSYTKLVGLDATPHQLRHTFSNLTYRSGTDPKTHQALLGHSNIQTSLNIYTVFDKDKKEESVQKTSDFLSRVLS